MVYAAMAVFAKKKARPGTAASMVCILGANYDGLGSAAGSLVGGLSVDKIGASLTFRYIGFSSVAAALLSALCYFLLRCTADHEYDITPEKPEPSTLSGTCDSRYSPKLEHGTLVENSPSVYSNRPPDLPISTRPRTLIVTVTASSAEWQVRTGIRPSRKFTILHTPG
ncbi:hypothetical protein MRX96_037208 [Rhipicephalus microplus]